jgi:hypothetical protein
MTGGLLQLVTAAGHEKVYLTNDPQVTFFKKIYRRITNFSFDYIELRPSSAIDFGGKTKFNLLHLGDLLHRLYLCIDIPDIAAQFFNLKTDDIYKTIKGTFLENLVIRNTKIKSTAQGSQIDVQDTIQIIEDTLICLQNELANRTQIINDINTMLNNISRLTDNIEVSMDSDNLEELEDETSNLFDFIKLKEDIINIWTDYKKEYYLIAAYNELLLEQRNDMSRYITFVDSNTITSLIIYGDFFYNIVADREILLMYLTKFFDILSVTSGGTADSLIKIFNTTFDFKFTIIDINLANNILEFNSLYDSELLGKIIHSNTPFSDLEIYFLLEQLIGFVVEKKLPDQIDYIIQRFSNYNTSYHYIINAYVAIINILKYMGTSLPIVIFKTFTISQPPSGPSYNMYNTSTPSIYNIPLNPISNGTDGTQFNTLIDPNYKLALTIRFNQEFIKDPNPYPTSYPYPTTTDNEYLQDKTLNLLDPVLNGNFLNNFITIIAEQVSFMTNNIERFMDILFSSKYNIIFNNTQTMRPNESQPLQGSSQFGTNYSIPTPTPPSPPYNNNFTNIMNLNFYLLGFLNLLLNKAIPNLNIFFTENTLPGFNTAFTTMLIADITGLVTNIYNNMIKALNDVCIGAHGIANIDMRNYIIPYFFSNKYNTNNNNSLVIASLFFHRDVIPSMFEIMYFPIIFLKQNYSSATGINAVNVNYTIKFFYEIIKNFMDVYDSFVYEPPANFIFDTDPDVTGNLFKKLADYTLNSNNVSQQFTEFANLSPLFLFTTTEFSRCVFYFVSEMIYMRETSKFYNSILFSEDFIRTSIGDTTYQTIKFINQIFVKLNNNSSVDVNILESDPFKTQKYYDQVFLNKYFTPNTNLYYKHFTNYSANTVILPNTSYYNNDFTNLNNVYNVQPGNLTTANIIYTYLDQVSIIDLDFKQIFASSYEIFSIDYYQIQPQIFLNTYTFNDPYVIEDYLIAIYELYEYMLRLRDNYPDDIYSELWQAFRTTKYLLTMGAANTAITGTDIPLNKYNDFFKNNFALYLTLPESIDVTPPPPPRTYSSAQDELDYYINLHAQSLPKMIKFFGYDTNSLIDKVINSNKYVASDITLNNVTTTSNLINIVEIYKSNFKNQYFIYVYLQQSVRNLEVLNNNKSKLEFKNQSYIIYQLLNSITLNTSYNNIVTNYFQNLSPNVFNYPESFPIEVTNTINTVNSLDIFSKRVSKLLIPFMNPTNNLIETYKDDLDLVNTNFEMMQQIYYYIVNTSLFTYVTNILNMFDKYFIIKKNLFDQLFEYIDNVIDDSTDPNNAQLLPSDITNMINICISFNMNPSKSVIVINDFASIFNLIVPYGNIIVKSLSTNQILRDSLDYLIIYSLIDITVTPDIQFNTYIIQHIFSPLIISQHPNLYNYFLLIDNRSIPFVNKFLNTLSIINITQINPVININANYYYDNLEIIDKYYDGFKTDVNLLEYLLDFIWDNVSGICDQKPIITYSLDVQKIHQYYENNILVHINEIQNDTVLTQNYLDMLIDQQQKQIKSSNKIKQNQIQDIINAVINDTNFNSNINVTTSAKISDTTNKSNETTRMNNSNGTVYPVSNYNYYIEKNKEWSDIINHEIKKINESIKKINDQLIIVINIKRQIFDILYRNKKAHCAWIKKLGHFIPKEIIFSSNGQIIDRFNSDWLNQYYELTHAVGHDKGYFKMIGNTKNLTYYDITIKEGRRLYIPLPLPFCRNTGMSLPLVSGIHSKFEIDIEYRSLDELTYKDQFSDFVDPTFYGQTGPHIIPYKPFIKNTFILAEYVYLEESERNLFASKRLEYLMEQVQYNPGVDPTDNDLINIFLLAGPTKTINVVKNVNGKDLLMPEEVIDESKGVEITEDMYDPTFMTLIPRKDVKYIKTTNQIGQKLLSLVPYDLGVSSDIIKKQFSYFLKFHHPIEFFTILTKMNRHTVLETRNYIDVLTLDYFYRERQFDNYGLFSYYDLSVIQIAKKTYYDKIFQEMSNPYNPTFGFKTCLVSIMNDYNQICMTNVVDPLDIYICSHHDLFNATLTRLIMQFDKTDMNTVLKNNYNIVRLKDNLQKLNLQFPIYTKSILLNIINLIMIQIGVVYTLTDADLIAILLPYNSTFNLTNFNIFKKELILIIYNLTQNEINMNLIKISDISDIVNVFYEYYNELQINLIIATIASYINLNVFDYDILNIFNIFYNLYSLLPEVNTKIVQFTLQIMTELNKLSEFTIAEYNFGKIPYISIKNIIYNIIPITSQESINFVNNYNYTIPFGLVNIIASLVNDKRNQILQNQIVNIIDYEISKIPRDKISPLMGAYFEFNGKDKIFPRADTTYWNYVQPYDCFLHTPSVGIGVYSFARNPLIVQPTGAANFTKIDEVLLKLYLHPFVSSTNSIHIDNYAMNYNVWRFMSGLNGLGYTNVGYK